MYAGYRGWLEIRNRSLHHSLFNTIYFKLHNRNKNAYSPKSLITNSYYFRLENVASSTLVHFEILQRHVFFVSVNGLIDGQIMHRLILFYSLCLFINSLEWIDLLKNIDELLFISCAVIISIHDLIQRFLIQAMITVLQRFSNCISIEHLHNFAFRPISFG